MDLKNINDTPSDVASILEKMKHTISGCRQLLIVLHNNPDPDALAAGFALKYLAEKSFATGATIVYGGYITRAENRAMVAELKIPLKNINRISFKRYDCYVMLDTQPGSGNHSLPSDVQCDVVIDHHPKRKGLKTKLAVIEPHIGTTSTILFELLQAAGIHITADLATALSYAIRSETQDLGREATERDEKAYFAVFPQASMRKLSKINRPKLTRLYFELVETALQRTFTFRQLTCGHLGEVEMPEIVAEMAGLFLRQQRITWSFFTGRFKTDLILSMRTSNPKGNAGTLIKKLVPERRNAGGHGTFAGGRIITDGMNKDEITQLEEKLSQQFARQFGYNTPEWKPLLDSHSVDT